MAYPNPMEFNGYLVTVATTEVNPGRWEASFTAQKGDEPPTTQWNVQPFATKEEAEQETLAMARSTLGGVI